MKSGEFQIIMLTIQQLTFGICRYCKYLDHKTWVVSHVSLACTVEKVIRFGVQTVTLTFRTGFPVFDPPKRSIPSQTGQNSGFFLILQNVGRCLKSRSLFRRLPKIAEVWDAKYILTRNWSVDSEHLLSKLLWKVFSRWFRYKSDLFGNTKFIVLT